MGQTPFGPFVSIMKFFTYVKLSFCPRIVWMRRKKSGRIENVRRIKNICIFHHMRLVGRMEKWRI